MAIMEIERDTNTAISRVVVSAITSLEDFHVLPVRDLARLGWIEDQLNPSPLTVWKEEEEQGQDLSNTEDVVVSLESLFSVPCPRTGKRARAKRIFPDTDDSKDLMVKFVDSGEMATVPRDSVRMLSTELLDMSGLAIHCSMYSCTAWGTHSRDVFSDLVVGHVWRLEVMGWEGGCEDDTEGVLHVDLCCIIEDNITSMRDVLIFSDRAKYSLSSCEAVLTDVEQRSFLPAMELLPGNNYSAIISHVRTDKVHVQMMCGEGRKATLALPHLMEEMASVYGVRMCEEMWVLGKPRVGVVCAVQDTKDGMWYRAQVETLVKPRILQVKYVDFGNTVLVADHRLRRLFPEFLEVPVVAQSVRLHLPNESARSAVSYLKNWLRYQELELEMVGGEGDVELRVDGWSVNQLLVEGDLPAFGG